MLIKLAWRNLWRQKRRTLLTASALALALLLSLLMRSFQEGSYLANINNVARLTTGLIQLQHSLFKESHSIDDLIPDTPEFITYAKQHRHLNTVLPRIESFALAANDEKSKGVLVYGIDAQGEDNYNQLSQKLVAGDYFSKKVPLNHPPVLIAEGLADKLNLSVGSELVLYGQGYHGQTAAGLFSIQGIVHFPIAALNNQMLYMQLSDAQKFYSAKGLVTSWILHSDDFDNIDTVVADLQQHYNKQISVRDWADLSPDVAQQITLDRVSGMIMMYLLYGIVGFGLFATLLMMTLERQREFAVMIATGLLRQKLLLLIAIESLYIGLIGIILGLLIAIPIVTWFYYYPITLSGETATLMLEMGYEPILPVLLSPALFAQQIFIVLVLLCVCLLYPLWRLYKMNLVSALKGGSHAN